MDTVKNRIDDNFPNISLTALSIKFLKARYYNDIDSTEIAKDLLHRSIKDNPYVFTSEAMLAQIYYNEKNIDSALYYSEKAFNGIPNNNGHRDIYFTTLKYLKDSLALDNSFEKLRNYNNPNHWYNYILARNDLNDRPDKRLINLLEDLKVKFPEEDTLKINNIKRFIEIGGERYTVAFVLSNQAKREFENSNYEEAAKQFESAITLNNQEYIFYENAAMVYDNLNDYEKAIEYYDKVIYEFKTNDGKSEFLKGLLLVKTEKQVDGCNYLRISVQKNYKDPNSGLFASNVYSSLCTGGSS
tara:strand:- start:1456 stop:2355 length:900 start_codon:yes stop_codon:yes gene_type:complete